MAASNTRRTLAARLQAPSDRKAVAYIIIIAASFLLLTTLLHLPHGPEHWSADLRTAFLSARPDTQHRRIALVYVTEKSLQPYAYLSPTERQMLADLIKAIDAANPAAIGFDFVIDRPTEAAKDAALLAAVRDAKAPVVLGAIDEPQPRQDAGKSYQADFLEKAKRSIGHLYFEKEHKSLVIGDHVIRLMAKPSYSRTYQETFADQLAQKVGTYPKPKSEYISWLLSPKDRTETFLTLSAEQVLGREGEPKLPIADMLRDRVVLVGGNFTDRDQHLIPLSVTDGRRYPGLFIHAQILAQIMDQRSLSTLSWPLQFIAFVVAAALGFWIGRRQRMIHLATELLSVVALIAIGILAFAYASLIFPYTGLLLTWLAGVSAGYYSRKRA
jgi:adenylate cyclase